MDKEISLSGAMKKTMFTGIIQALGTVRSITRKGADAVIEIEGDINTDEVRLGDSIAVNGSCLTVIAIAKNRFSANISAETMARTNLKLIHGGDKVNLEKALRMTDFLGGHLVLGHVDETGFIRERAAKSSSIVFGVEISPKIERYVVEKGSITIDGISLTVNKLEERRLYVNVIPHTAGATTLGFRKIGDMVNIEADIIGKYVERFVRPAPEQEKAERFDWSSLA
ncbi:MAG: riboflavin synthase [Syntrophobacterales bacterium]|nr:riboflavin synthase [Syntrophobacterales bacterium]